jgi:signal transduction histidine kinase
VVHLSATGVDITERREAERGLRERFVSMLTHDLRTPLAAASAAAQLLQRVPDDRSRVLHLAAQIHRGVERMDAMIRDLLDVSRLRAGESLPLQVEAQDLSEVVTEAVEGLRMLHGERLELRTDGPLPGRWSAQAVTRIVENLVGNAFKYGSDKGPVEVRLCPADDGAVLEVSNTGRPIPPEELSQLFDPFRRSSAAFAGGKKGWGIGLALVRGLAEAHGGAVGAQSSADDGTTFWVRLPRHPPSEVALLPAP